MLKGFWRALYTSGHDTACLNQTANGWSLEGTAVYLRDAAPVSLSYRLDLSQDWSTLAGVINGRVGDQQVMYAIRRAASGWWLNDEHQDGLDGVVDLDFGFTPATNYAQLRRMDLAIGERAEITVAWIDVDCTSLESLPQIYKRVADDAYDYESPQGDYKATLLLEPTGFVRLYPGLWESELH